jgi:hypothetical protein
VDEVDDYEIVSESCDDIGIERPFINPADFRDIIDLS